MILGDSNVVAQVLPAGGAVEPNPRLCLRVLACEHVCACVCVLLVQSVCLKHQDKSN